MEKGITFDYPIHWDINFSNCTCVGRIFKSW